MQYRNLGSSSLKISNISLGTWVFGGDSIWWGKQNEKNSIDVLYKSYEAGINLIDTAPIYGKGKSETIIGKFLKESKLRNKLYIATKCGLIWNNNNKIEHNLSKKSILKEFDDSRKRLGIDVIDLYQIHYPDKNTAIHETAETLLYLYESKKIKAIGVSNFSVKQMKEFLKYAPIHSLQPPYNLFARHIEKKEIPFCIKNNIGIISYVPLQQGILTGKYHFLDLRPKGLNRRKNPDLNNERFKITKHILLKLKKIAGKYNLSLAQFSIVWILNQKGITAPIVGARNTEQIKENTDVSDIKLSKDDLLEIDKILEERKKLIDEIDSKNK